jgi:hypothetical protein
VRPRDAPARVERHRDGRVDQRREQRRSVQLSHCRRPRAVQARGARQRCKQRTAHHAARLRCAARPQLPALPPRRSLMPQQRRRRKEEDSNVRRPVQFLELSAFPSAFETRWRAWSRLTARRLRSTW